MPTCFRKKKVAGVVLQDENTKYNVFLLWCAYKRATREARTHGKQPAVTDRWRHSNEIPGFHSLIDSTVL